MIRRLALRTHRRVVTKSRTESRNAAAIIAPPAGAASPVSSAPSSSRARQHYRPRDASGDAVSRRAFASIGTSDAIEAEFVKIKDAPPTTRNEDDTSDAIEAGFSEKKDSPPATDDDDDVIKGMMDFIEEGDAPPTTKNDDEAAGHAVPSDWCGAAPDRATYGRIVDAARLVAEVAYDTNEAVVGALAEAGGDEGAAERWLRGVVVLLEGSAPPVLPAWWDAGHREEVLRLARRRNGGHYAKRGLDVARLKADLGREAFDDLEEVALEVYACVIMRKEVEDRKKDEDDMIPGAMTFSKEATDQAIRTWGEDTANQLFKKTQEELEEEENVRRMEASGAFKVEEGDWWGAASNENPAEAYRRLIDGARLGTMLAYDDGDHKGSIADSFKKVLDDEKASKRSPGGKEEDVSTGEEAEGEESAVHLPEVRELGSNATDHFRQFLKEMKGENPKNTVLMPEWWDGAHDVALWKLAADTDSEHFLGYAMDESDAEETYDKTVLYKIKAMAAVAKDAGGICLDSYDMGGLDDEGVEDEEHVENPTADFARTQDEYTAHEMEELEAQGERHVRAKQKRAEDEAHLLDTQSDDDTREYEAKEDKEEIKPI